MKLTIEEIKQALALLALKERSEDEQKAFDALEAKCDGEDNIYAQIAAFKSESDDDEDGKDADKDGDEKDADNDKDADKGKMDESDVTRVVTKALENVLEGAKIDPTDIVKQVAEAAKASKDGITLELIEKAIEDQIGGAVQLNNDELLKSIAELIPQETKGATVEEIKALFEPFAEKLKRETKMEHPTGGGVSLPISHRSGNLSVAKKQLLNILLMKVSDEVIPANDKPKHMNDGITDEQLRDAESRGAKMLEDHREAVRQCKDITTSGSGTGLELIETDLSSDLHSRLYLKSSLATLMLGSEIQMPSDPFKMPLTTTLADFFVGSEGGTPTESTPGTAAITLETVKLIGKVQYSYESDEDAIVAILPMITSSLVKGAAKAFESGVLSGDVSTTHQDTDYEAIANHHAKAFKGLRFMGLAQAETKVDLATGGISADNIRAMIKKMGKYGTDPSMLALVLGPKGYSDIVGIDETLTVDKVGPAARILSGTSASIWGIPIIVSEEAREDLNASGVDDGSVETKGSVILFNKEMFVVGTRRGFTVETDRNISTQLVDVVASYRREFEAWEAPSATVPSVCVGFNYNHS